MQEAVANRSKASLLVFVELQAREPGAPSFLDVVELQAREPPLLVVEGAREPPFLVASGKGAWSSLLPC